jgi:hypothetical protein
VLRSKPDPFPYEAVRDLLGIARALYAARASSAGARELTRIREVGEELRLALELAGGSSPGSVGRAAAWARAEQAALRVGELVDAMTPAEPIIAAARARVVGARAALASRRRKTPER